MPTVFNAANEKAVAMFLNREIGYPDIPRIIEEAMMDHRKIADPSLRRSCGRSRSICKNREEIRKAGCWNEYSCGIIDIYRYRSDP